MTEWIPATRETPGYYSNEEPLRRSAGPTCTQRQDAALEELFSIVTLLATDIYTLRKRVIALEAQMARSGYAITAPARTDAIDDRLDYDLDAAMTALTKTKHAAPSATLRQYCAAVDGDDDPDPMEDV